MDYVYIIGTIYIICVVTTLIVEPKTRPTKRIYVKKNTTKCAEHGWEDPFNQQYCPSCRKLDELFEKYQGLGGRH